MDKQLVVPKHINMNQKSNVCITIKLTDKYIKETPVVALIWDEAESALPQISK